MQPVEAVRPGVTLAPSPFFGPNKGSKRVETDEPTTVEACHRLIAQLHDALRTRDLIGQAKGVLMGAQGISDEDAFLILVRASQRTNRKLRDVAADVITAHTAGVRQAPVMDEADDCARVVPLTGEIDMSTATVIAQAVQPALADGARDLILDMSHVTFIDSSGLNALLEVHASISATGARLAVRSPSRAVRRVIEIAGLDSLLPIQQ